jgi:hypothetical protein
MDRVPHTLSQFRRTWDSTRPGNIRNPGDTLPWPECKLRCCTCSRRKDHLSCCGSRDRWHRALYRYHADKAGRHSTRRRNHPEREPTLSWSRTAEARSVRTARNRADLGGLRACEPECLSNRPFHSSDAGTIVSRSGTEIYDCMATSSMGWKRSPGNMRFAIPAPFQIGQTSPRSCEPGQATQRSVCVR